MPSDAVLLPGDIFYAPHPATLDTSHYVHYHPPLRIESVTPHPTFGPVRIGMIFTNRYFIAVGIPFLLIFLGAVARKLIRATPFIPDDFYLGVDLSIAGISAGLIYTSELLTAKADAAGCATSACRMLIAHADDRLLRDSTFLSVALFLFLLILAFHQDKGGNAGTPRRRMLMLGVVSNVIGVVLLACFILLVKGIAP
jgi:hypothetical protein